MLQVWEAIVGILFSRICNILVFSLSFVSVCMLVIALISHANIFACLHGFWMLVCYSFIQCLITIICSEWGVMCHFYRMGSVRKHASMSYCFLFAIIMLDLAFELDIMLFAFLVNCEYVHQVACLC